MRLFFQLNPDEQNNVLNHCANLVMDDMIEEGVKLDPITPEEITIKEKLEAAVEHIKQYTTKEEKINYLLADATISQTIYEIALEMAKGAYYHSSDELVIFPDEVDKQPEQKELLLPEPQKAKKISHLN